MKTIVTLEKTPSISDDLIKMLPQELFNQQGKRVFRESSSHASESLSQMLERHVREADDLVEMRRLVKDAEQMDQIGS